MSSWIKMRNDLAQDPAVIGVSACTGLDEFAVVGRLHALWSWADQHTTDGNAPCVTEAWLDRYLSCEGFAKALQKVGWLLIKKGRIEIPEFDRHNSESAKRRALTAIRASKSRAKNVTQPALRTAHLDKNRIDKIREEKRREEKSHETSPSSTEIPARQACTKVDCSDPDSIRSFFASVEGGIDEIKIHAGAMIAECIGTDNPQAIQSLIGRILTDGDETVEAFADTLASVVATAKRTTMQVQEKPAKRFWRMMNEKWPSKTSLARRSQPVPAKT